ncbi:MAG: hypothetical protein B6D55_06330 [Candidatus Omnitrophica bacterium 4484_70.2]|nr:MAG: hypothetical protein B6D55_06330 [Candidatus Omnitrophica bacterium 4484_70.2]
MKVKDILRTGDEVKIIISLDHDYMIVGEYIGETPTSWIIQVNNGTAIVLEYIPKATHILIQKMNFQLTTDREGNLVRID